MTAQTAEGSGFFRRLKTRLNRGRAWVNNDLKDFVTGRIDDEALEDLETHLLMADVGVDATETIMAELRRRLPRVAAGDTITSHLDDILVELLQPMQQTLIPEGSRPFVLLVVGVNGTGKTTTIGKLAQRFTNQGLTVMLAAADTFRAAAVEQLQVWAERSGAELVAQTSGADPAAVVFDALNAARARGTDVLIADTAGRLHSHAGLMDELKKIARVMARIDERAPHETLLVLDASQGQNALAQAEQFHAAVGLTGLAVTKLDGTAKGGIVLAIAKKLAVPIRYIGIGEGVEDLQKFDARQYVKALLYGDTL